MSVNIAIIPARGGSRRIPRKNIKSFDGIPMIAHAIKTARASELFDHVIVSTEDAEIAAVAREWGAKVPFERPLELADDHTPTVPVIAHAIAQCELLGWRVINACCIYPCAPFICTEDIRIALAALEKSGANFCFPVARFPSPVQRANFRDLQGRLQPMYPEYQLTRTQDLEPAYFDPGQFYWGTKQGWITNTRIHTNAITFELPYWRAVDIDTPDDWQYAELLYQVIKSKTKEITP